MSNSAKSHMRVEFNQNVPIAISSATALEQTLRDFYRDSRNDNLARPDFTITEFELYDNEVEVTFYSTRRINLDFQIDLFQEYLYTIHSDIVEEVNEDTWVQG